MGTWVRSVTHSWVGPAVVEWIHHGPHAAAPTGPRGSSHGVWAILGGPDCPNKPIQPPPFDYDSELPPCTLARGYCALREGYSKSRSSLWTYDA
jgi:hypothetical protein